jgi:hypothetical protein
MRFLGCLLIVACSSFTSAVQGEEQVEGQLVLTSELVEAQYALQLARLQVREYQFVTLPATRRALDDQVELAETEIAVLSRRLRDYEPFLRVGEYSPVRTAAESFSLSYVAAEQRLRQLQDARIDLMRSTRQQYTLYNLQVLHAMTRVAQLRREQLADAQ